MKIFMFLLILLPVTVWANPTSTNHCDHNGDTIAVGESIWVFDPRLVEMTAQTLRDKGYSQALIDKEISHNDWVGYRLVCVKTYQASQTNETTKPGEVLNPTGVALILNPYSGDFYQHVITTDFTSIKQ